MRKRKEEKEKNQKVNVHDSLRDGASVGSDHADLQALGDAPDTVGVRGEEVTGETDGRGVGQFLKVSYLSVVLQSQLLRTLQLAPRITGQDPRTYDNFLLRGELDQSSKGTESLLIVQKLRCQSYSSPRALAFCISCADCHSPCPSRSIRKKTYTVSRDVGQDGRLHIAQLAALATDEDLGPLGDGIFDVLDDLVGLTAVDQGSVGTACQLSCQGDRRDSSRFDG